MFKILGPLSNLTCQDTKLCLSEKQKESFQITKELLQDDTIVVNHDPSIFFYYYAVWF